MGLLEQSKCCHHLHIATKYVLPLLYMCCYKHFSCYHKQSMRCHKQCASSHEQSTCCHKQSTFVSFSLLVAELLSNMLAYLRDVSAQTSVRAATLRMRLQFKLSISLSHSIPTPGQPVPAPAPAFIMSGVWQGCHWTAKF